MPKRKKLKRFLGIIRDNEKIQQEFFDIEKTILRIHTFKDLISTLLDELKNRFGLDHVGITFINGTYIDHDINIQSLIKNAGNLCNIMNETEATRFLLKNARPRLENEHIDTWSLFFPPNILKSAGSVAVIPLRIDDTLIGSINLSDNSTERYSPSRATLFLERLAIIISICIDNVLSHERLKHISVTDPLTGLSNRRQIYAVLKNEMRLSERYGDPFSVIYIDINDFKIINDSYGHDVGDLYLQHVARLLVDECRDSDCVSRFGGDEFVIALCRSNKVEAEATKERIEKRLATAPLILGTKKIPVQASFGQASTDEIFAASVDDLLKIADNNLYSEKKKKHTKKIQTEEVTVT